MTKEQYEKIATYLDMNNIDLDVRQLTELEDAIAEAKGKERPILLVESDHMYFDATRQNELVTVMLELLSVQPDAGKQTLITSIFAIAGHFMAMNPDTEMMYKALEKFADYVRDIRKGMTFSTDTSLS